MTKAIEIFETRACVNEMPTEHRAALCQLMADRVVKSCYVCREQFDEQGTIDSGCSKGKAVERTETIDTASHQM